MFYLTGQSEVLKTLILLGKTMTDNKIETLEQLQSSYRSFVDEHSTGGIVAPFGSSQYCYDHYRIKKISEKFISDCKLTDLKTEIVDDTPLEAMQSALSKVSQSQEYIMASNRDLYSVFQLVIHTLFYARSKDSGGGSVSDAIGAIWCSNKKSWNTHDLAEFLVHEFTHNLVFLDEICYKHYYDYDIIAKPENYALSAILNRNRPLDKVFHSLIVAFEVLQFRNDAGHPESPAVHPSTPVLVESCMKTIESINLLLLKNDQLVTDRFTSLVKLVSDKMNSILVAQEGYI